MIGIIGGSGLYAIEGVIIKKRSRLKTPYGSPSDAFVIGELQGRKIAFLPRHGSKHSVPPHRINYRANIWGMKELGVQRIISVSATGGISSRMKPGTIAVLDQIIDLTKVRSSTFYEGEAVHIDFTEPYCPEMRRALLEASGAAGIGVMKSGTYLCTEGPRLETRSEIGYFSRIGADVVGMTGMPEASLAREAEICYAGVAVVTNYAAGLTGDKLTASEVIKTMAEATGHLKILVKEALGRIPVRRKCLCKEALREARI
ncbi:MAG: S-methyl-5'-thioadenosine phosphorylase [Nitrospirota bacterium]